MAPPQPTVSSCGALMTLLWVGSLACAQPPAQAGFPVTFPPLASGQVNTLLEPTVADLDGDGLPEIIFSTFDGVRVYGGDGQPWPGWPYLPDPIPGAQPRVLEKCLVGDLDGDGVPEIVVVDHYSQLHALTPLGQLKAGWPVAPPESENKSHIALVDIDGDGALEVAARGRDLSDCYFYLYRGDGTPAPGWPRYYDWNGPGSMTIGPPHAADLDYDGKEELVIGLSNTYGGSEVLVFEEGGVFREGWPAQPYATSTYLSYLVLADLNDDHVSEIVGYGNGAMGALREDGVPYWWTAPPPGAAMRNIACGDLDGDGSLEIILAGYNLIRIFASDSTILRDTFPDGYWSHRAVSLADIDGDGDLEISARIQNSSFSVFLQIYDHELNPLPGFPIELPLNVGQPSFDTTAFADLDGDGDLEIVLTVGNILYAFDLPNSGGTPRIVWQQRGNTARMSSWYHDDKRHFFLRGDANRDGVLDVTDAVVSLEYLFLSRAVGCEVALDANDDGALDISDPAAALIYLFSGGPDFDPPFPGCIGFPIHDTMTCVESGCP